MGLSKGSWHGFIRQGHSGHVQAPKLLPCWAFFSLTISTCCCAWRAHLSQHASWVFRSVQTVPDHRLRQGIRTRVTDMLLGLELFVPAYWASQGVIGISIYHRYVAEPGAHCPCILGVSECHGYQYIQPVVLFGISTVQVKACMYTGQVHNMGFNGLSVVLVHSSDQYIF
jgi:hypothetical protein